MGHESEITDHYRMVPLEFDKIFHSSGAQHSNTYDKARSFGPGGMNQEIRNAFDEIQRAKSSSIMEPPLASIKEDETESPTSPDLKKKEFIRMKEEFMQKITMQM